MRSTRSMLGLPVICQGESIGRLSQVELNEDLTQVQGIYLQSGFAGARYIECADLDLLGEVSILTRSSGKRVKSPPKPPLRRAVGSNGQRLGAITDALIDEDQMSIHSLELSHGFFEDLMSGRSQICQYSVCPNGEILVRQTEGGADQ